MFIVVAVRPKQAGLSTTHHVVSSGDALTHEFATIDEARLAAARSYRSLCSNAGKPTCEVKYHIFDMSKAEATAEIVPPPELTWK